MPRIKPERYDDWDKCSRLLKLLSLFEQNWFIDKKYLKKYVYRIPKPEKETDKILKKMITTLEQISSDPYARRVMEEEEFMAMNIEFWKKSIVNKDSIIANRDSIIAAVSAELSQRDTIIANKDNIIANRETIIAAVSAELSQKDKELSQSNKELEEYKRRYGTLNGATH